MIRGLKVSRETSARLEAYEALLLEWAGSVNLISRSTIPSIRERHILDSAQLYPIAKDDEAPWVDLGSGGGLPGIVLAILAAGDSKTPEIHLVESDVRKATFLHHVVRELALPVRIIRRRIEDIEPFQAGLITARALAPLPILLDLSSRFLGPSTRLLFPKGKRVDSELTAARADWHIEVEIIKSGTDPLGRILSLSNVERRKTQ